MEGKIGQKPARPRGRPKLSERSPRHYVIEDRVVAVIDEEAKLKGEYPSQVANRILKLWASRHPAWKQEMAE